MPHQFEAIISWLGLPIYIWQGLGVRKISPRLQPPKPQQIPEIKGKGEQFRLLLIGDSSAAGVGVEISADALGGQVCQILNERTKRPVSIHIAGCNSATSGQIRDHVLPNIEGNDFTHIIVNLGTNDAKNFHTGKRFCSEFGTLLYALNAKFPHARIIWSGILDFSKVTNLPSPFRHILGIRARELVRRGTILCNERLGEVVEGEWSPERANFSHDGFHASEKGYHEWGQMVVTHILDRDPSKSKV